MGKRKRIGLDFDNTIVGYDELFATLALEQGMLTRVPEGGKPAIRENLRSKGEQGELEWQRLQSLAYGARIGEAKLIEGVAPFILSCRRRNCELFIVSHKTRYAGMDPGGVNLRRAALDWMSARNFFDEAGLGFKRADIYFAGTRFEKIERIRLLRCDLFIDDLIEVFTNPAFPTDVEAVLFSPGPGFDRKASSGVKRVAAFVSWKDIAGHVFK